MNTAMTGGRSSERKFVFLSAGLAALLAANTASPLINFAGSNPSDAAAYGRAIQYLSRSPTARRVINLLENSTRTYTIVFSGRPSMADAASGDEYDAATRTIYWIPTYGFQWTKGFSGEQRVTPALCLIHELGHAAHHEADNKTFQRNSHAKVLTWDTREEELTVHKIEHVVAKDLGEPRRTEHRVSGFVEDPQNGSYQTESSTSTAPAAEGHFQNLIVQR